jgi:hypothetical protein
VVQKVVQKTRRRKKKTRRRSETSTRLTTEMVMLHVVSFLVAIAKIVKRDIKKMNKKR